MKKLKVLGLAAMAVGMTTLTSCLNGGGNTSSGATFGYADFSTEAGGIVVKDDYGTVVASTAFNTQLVGGEYVQYAYSIDFDNQPSTKYITATVAAIEKYQEYRANEYITDTTTIMPKEMTIKNIQVALMSQDYLLIARKHAFIAPVHANIATDMKIRYDLSYDAQAEPVTVEGKRVYEFFIRAVKLADGDKTKQDTPVIGAYDLGYFLTRTSSIEKTAGNTSVNFRINYINEFNKDSTSWNWAKSSVFQYLIPAEK